MPPPAPSHHYRGANYLRQRLILSTLTRKPVKITDIRTQAESPGLEDFEANLLRLLDSITNGTNITVSETGTTLYYSPGELVGGDITHDCNVNRPIAYYLEVLLCLAPFCKLPVQARLRGVTHCEGFPSVDTIRTVTLPIMAKLGVNNDNLASTAQGSLHIVQPPLSLKVESRGDPAAPGIVSFTCPIIKGIPPVELLNEGRIRRVRGVAWTSRVSPQYAPMMIDSCRAVLNPYLADVWVFTDAAKKLPKEARGGYGLSLVAETESGALISADAMSEAAASPSHRVTDPGDLGKEVARALIEEIDCGGVVDRQHQWLTAIFMSMAGDYKVSSAVFGQELSPYTIAMIRNIKDFMGVRFKFTSQKTEEEVVLNEEDEEKEFATSRSVKLRCVGAGLKNATRRTF
ncbi:rRNA-processing endoribonuclease [Perkinsus chesapeaki]|uniref:rRNA-processing endoribonuclease n=1 Tax=Perkinsus chesapeaki TaxID=330153 RepID=A0A7J6L2K1_PERCH|nr:rRNA-processing endoribonuclease [Perkinsus chesapeaki]